MARDAYWRRKRGIFTKPGRRMLSPTLRNIRRREAYRCENWWINRPWEVLWRPKKCSMARSTMNDACRAYLFPRTRLRGKLVPMKPLLLALFFGSLAANGQSSPPDCQFTATFTAATAGASFNNRTSAGATPCVKWRVAYFADGLSGMSIQLEGANDSNGSAGTYAAIAQANCYEGSNPMTDAAQSTAAMTAYYPWIRLNVTVFTPIGGAPHQIVARVYGYKGTSAGGSVGGFTAAATFPLSGATAVSASDLAIDATLNTKVTSASHTFVAADVGKAVVVTSGTGFTPGAYTIASISGAAAVMSSAVGTVGSTSGVWSMAAQMICTHNFDTAAVLWPACKNQSGTTIPWYALGGSSASTSVTDFYAISLNAVDVVFSGTTTGECDISTGGMGPTGPPGATGPAGAVSASGPPVAHQIALWTSGTNLEGVSPSSQTTYPFFSGGSSADAGFRAIADTDLPTSALYRSCTIDNDTQSATALTAAQFSGGCQVAAASHIVEIDVIGSTLVLNGTAASFTYTGAAQVGVGISAPGSTSTADVMSALLLMASGVGCSLPTAGTATCPIMGIQQMGSSQHITTTAVPAGDLIYISAAVADTPTHVITSVFYTVD